MATLHYLPLPSTSTFRPRKDLVLHSQAHCVLLQYLLSGVPWRGLFRPEGGEVRGRERLVSPVPVSLRWAEGVVWCRPDEAGHGSHRSFRFPYGSDRWYTLGTLTGRNGLPQYRRPYDLHTVGGVPYPRTREEPEGRHNREDVPNLEVQTQGSRRQGTLTGTEGGAGTG